MHSRDNITFIFLILLCIIIASPAEGQEPKTSDKRKILKAVIPVDSPPTYYKDSKTNKAAGFAVDIMDAIGKVAGYSVTYQFKKDWLEIIQAVKDGAADVAPGMGITEERKKVLSFTSPTDAFPVSVFVRANGGITELRDNMKVGVITGSAAYEKLREKYRNLVPVTYDSFEAGLIDLLAGELDAFCCPAPTLMALARNADIDDRIKIVGPPLLELKRTIALRQDNRELLAELNRAIQNFVRTPQYQQIYSKWYGKPKPYWTVERFVIVSAVFVIIVIVVMGGWRHYSIVSLNKNLIKAREQLRQSEYLSRTIIETEPECIQIIDAQGNLMFMNRAGLNMIEAESLEQVQGRCIYPFVSSNYRDAFMALTRDVCNGDTGTLTFEMEGLKGRRLWLETHAVPFRNEKNEIIALLGISRDITEKRIAEAALEKSEANFRTLFNKSADALFLVKPDGGIADVNDVVCTRYNYSREELLKMNVSQIDSPSTRKYTPERIEKIEKKGVAVFEAEHVTKDGKIIPTEVNANLVMLGDEPLLISTCRDITERKKAEEAITDEKERLAVTLRSIGDGVIVTDIEGHITLVNNVAEKLTGWSNEQARGRSLTEVFNILNETTGEKCENPVEQVLKTGMIVGLTNHTALVRKDGTQIIIADSAAPIKDRRSRTIGVVLVFRDITAQYRMENEMQKLEKLESLGLFAGGLAHDFNNLLTSIMGNISLVKMQLGVDHRSFNRLTDAEKAAQRATDLTHQLLTFAKGGAPIKNPACLAEIAKEACHFAMSGSKVKCLYTIPPALWNAEVDKGQVSQVFNNLIINSIHAMPNGGKVHVDFENVTLRENEVVSLRSGNYVKIVFRDEGTGIPEDRISKIFDPYFTTKPGGSGLGLATVLSIINRHEGCISVESKVGIGTRFTIYLPAMVDTIFPAVEETNAVQAGHGTILIMDDEELVRDVAGEILKALGYGVAFANDGKEAIESYLKAEREQRPFAAVIMDLTIPGGMGGKEAVRNLLAVAPDAKVIVSSGYSTDPIMAEYDKYGFCGVVNKPYNVNAMSEMISRVVGM